MEKRFRSIVDQLSDYIPRQDADRHVETRALQIITSAQNFLQLLSETYAADVADDLSKRFIRAIVAHDEEKFSRRLRAIREARNDDKDMTNE